MSKCDHSLSLQYLNPFLPHRPLTGNNRQGNKVAAPACSGEALSVGAVFDAKLPAAALGDTGCISSAPDAVACFSNSHTALSLLAPGCQITAGATPAAAGGKALTKCGTSQAAPHVAGAVAVLRAAAPAASLEQVSGALRWSGVAIADPRDPATVVPRLNLGAAVDMLLAMTAAGDNGTAAPDFAPPEVTNFTINGGAPVTPDLAVTVAIEASDASGVAEMCLANKAAGGDCAGGGAGWVPFAAATPWSLSPGGDGLRRVFLWLRDGAGNAMMAPARAAISADVSAPLVPRVTLAGGARYIRSPDNVRLDLSALDPGGLAAVCWDQLGDGAAPCAGEWGAFGDTMYVNLSSAEVRAGWRAVPWDVLGLCCVGPVLCCRIALCLAVCLCVLPAAAVAGKPGCLQPCLLPPRPLQLLYYVPPAHTPASTPSPDAASHPHPSGPPVAACVL